MKGSLQQRINPHTAPRTMDFNTGKKESKGQKGAAEGGGNKTPFKNLIMNSNAAMQRKRAAQDEDGLAAADTDKEFLDKMRERADRNKPEPPSPKLDKDAFMKLFVTQLQHQDPLKPDKSSKMASQLAQFNSLEQMNNVNKNIKKLASQQARGRAVGLIDFVGKHVQVDGGKLAFKDGKVTNATFELQNKAPQAKLEVRDKSGVVVGEQDLGSLNPGEHKIKFDGLKEDGEKLGDGVYSFSVVAKGPKGQPVEAPIKSTVKVTGVDLQKEGGQFYSEIGPLKVTDVSSVGTKADFAGANDDSSKDGAKQSGSKPTPDAAPAASRSAPKAMSQNNGEGPSSGSPNSQRNAAAASAQAAAQAQTVRPQKARSSTEPQSPADTTRSAGSPLPSRPASSRVPQGADVEVSQTESGSDGEPSA